MPQKHDYDSPWKEILEYFFSDFMAFFFPKAHNDIDWSKKHEFLDKELQRIVKDAETGKRLVDKLVKVWQKNGDEKWVLVHIEVQSQEEIDFAKRMYIYNYRLFDRYDRQVASIAVLGDEHPNWKPNQFGYNLWDCKIDFEFPVIKLLDYKKRWEMLEKSENPFATVLMAHLKAQETRNNDKECLFWKIYVTRRLYKKGRKPKYVVNLFRFIDGIMQLPEELEDIFLEKVEELEEEKRMPYVAPFEKILAKRGMEKGLQQGLQQGMRQGLLLGIELGLKLKFGDKGLDLFPEISKIGDVEVLKAIQIGIETSNTIDELRKIYE
jgi:hypothetical protein